MEKDDQSCMEHIVSLGYRFVVAMDNIAISLERIAKALEPQIVNAIDEECKRICVCTLSGFDDDCPVHGKQNVEKPACRCTPEQKASGSINCPVHCDPPI